MKITLYTLAAFLFFISNTVFAQQFINGSLEPASPGAFSYCTFNSAATFNANMGNCTLVGSKTVVYVADSNCATGPAHTGSHYVALTTDSTFATNALIFKLDKPMIANTAYYLEFDYTSGYAVPYNQCPLRYGYSITGTTLDSFVGSIPSPGGTAWEPVGRWMTPTVAAQYVWIAADTETFNVNNHNKIGNTYVDFFHMKNVPAASVNNVGNNTAIQVFPNPFSNSTKLTICNDVELPYNLAVYDITGRLVMLKQNNNDRELLINKDDIGIGMFFIKLNDNNHQTYCTKLVSQ
jgi:hypothetical protein